MKLPEKYLDVNPEVREALSVLTLLMPVMM